MAGGKAPRIAFRVDASLSIGTGHVMRCLTLADRLRDQGAVCRFLCRSHKGDLTSLVEERGYAVARLTCRDTAAKSAIPAERASGPAHAHWLGVDWAEDCADTVAALGTGETDWLVVDHYALNRSWERALRPRVRRLMVIDDLADRSHDCDLLLDQTLGRIPTDYAAHVGSETQLLLGARFALLRPEFRKLRQESLARRVRPEFNRILVTMGGMDQDNVTGAVLDMLDRAPLPEDLQIVVVMGRNAPWLAEVRRRAACMGRLTRVLSGVDDMARLMADSDLAIGAAGGTAWERCCMGLPSFCLVLAANQSVIATILDAAGAAVTVCDPNDIAAVLARYDSQAGMTAFLAGLAKASASITDGEGALHVARKMMTWHD
ncbi:UDP-2,4-diacetamido-2,4,6-trideoxy-beta-L-altropyranose hydrolase [Paracoccus maritimus]|nr:UDP-2,4-diacetamido-2,4,6-trideoxy-beta-L-altropyranose hydrolase [Paracoccus sp. YLB-12]